MTDDPLEYMLIMAVIAPIIAGIVQLFLMGRHKQRDGYRDSFRSSILFVMLYVVICVIVIIWWDSDISDFTIMIGVPLLVLYMASAHGRRYLYFIVPAILAILSAMLYYYAVISIKSMNPQPTCGLGAAIGMIATILMQSLSVLIAFVVSNYLYIKKLKAS